MVFHRFGHYRLMLTAGHVEVTAHLPATWQVGPSAGFSLIMHRLVSSETRTVESKGIWNAVRMYCVRIIGRSCLASTTFWVSTKKFRNFSISASLLPCA